MNWIEKFKTWDYRLDGVFEWLLNLMEFHIQRAGILGYIGIVLFIIGVGLAFPATRGVTGLIVSGAVRLFFDFIKNLLTLVTRDLITLVGRLVLAIFHRTHRWVADLVSRTKGD